MGREEVNEVENRTEPKQLVGNAGVRTALVEPCNPGVMIEEPIQNWIQRGGTSFSDEGMIVALTFSIAARAKSNRTEASAIHGNVGVAGATRAE